MKIEKNTSRKRENSTLDYSNEHASLLQPRKDTSIPKTQADPRTKAKEINSGKPQLPRHASGAETIIEIRCGLGFQSSDNSDR